MKIASEKLIEDLIKRTQIQINKTKEFKSLSISQLNHKVNAESWSILECLEHLNLYGDFYIPEIQNSIENSKFVAKKTFKSGIIGNYFAKSMLPKEKLNKMKTFQDKNPVGSQLDLGTIDRFIKQNEELLILLNESRKVDLTKTKTSISISKWLKLKLGDTFRVVVYHNERHISQAQRQLTNDN